MSKRDDLIPAIIKPLPVDDPKTVAGLEMKLEAARNEADVHREKADKLLSNFKGKGGKHGPLATAERSETIPIRLPGAVCEGLERVAKPNSIKRASLLKIVAVAVSQIDPDRLFEALAELKRFR